MDVIVDESRRDRRAACVDDGVGNTDFKRAGFADGGDLAVDRDDCVGDEDRPTEIAREHKADVAHDKRVGFRVQ